jgi:hypothetical protein
MQTATYKAIKKIAEGHCSTALALAFREALTRPLKPKPAPKPKPQPKISEYLQHAQANS